MVLRSTTVWAAVSSRNSSARETVISRLPVGGAAVTSGVSVAVDTIGFSPAIALILGDRQGFVQISGHVDLYGASVRFRSSAFGGVLNSGLRGMFLKSFLKYFFSS